MPAPGNAQRAASKFMIFENFEKLNTAELRTGLKEAELAWVENLQPIASNNWATVPGPGSQLTSIGGQTILYLYFGVINGIDYVVAFTTTGAGYAIKSDGTVIQFAPNGTFSTNPGPDMTTWQQERFLFNDSVAGYSTWDGTTFTRQGGVAPNIAITNGGSGYTSAPSVTISGGSGSGAAAVAAIGTPSVTALVLDNGGSGYSTVPTVVFAGGGGSGAHATVNIDPRSITGVNPFINVGAYTYHGVLPIPITVSLSGGGGSGGVLTATWGANMANQFFLQTLTISNPGSGYTSAPTVVFTPGAGVSVVTPAVATVTVGAGQILSFNFNPATDGGSGYTSAPSVSFSGGGGSGATAHATIGGSSVISITLTNPGHGYLPSDVLTVTIGAPPAGGVQATAVAQVAPFLPNGTSVAVFQGRVWLNFYANGQLVGLQWSGTGSATVEAWNDWNAGHASGSLLLPDADLVHQITGLRSFNNFLWIIGDQSIKQIGNISLNNAGNVTLFTILTLSSDQGTTYLRSCISFNRVFFFANQQGVYAVFGSSVQKVSGDLDGIFQQVDFSLQPQGALVDINNVHNVMWLLKYNDTQFFPGSRSIFVIFNGQRWYVGSMGNGVRAVTTSCSLATPRWVPVGSSGGDITPLFFAPSTQVPIYLQTALSHHGNPVQRKKTVRQGYAMSLSSGTASLTGRMDSDENAGLTFPINLNAGFNNRTIADPNVSGTYLGMTITGTLAGFTLSNLRTEFQETNIGNQN